MPTSTPTGLPAGAGEPVRRHHVLILASKGPGTVIAAACRNEGLAVGSWLLPPYCPPRTVRTLLRNALSSPADRPVWQTTPVVVTAWTSADAHMGASVTSAVHAAVTTGRPGPAPRWLHLSGARHPHPTVIAPLTVTDHGIYAPPTTRRILRAALEAAPAWTSWSAVLRAVLGAVPSSPGHLDAAAEAARRCLP